MEVGLRIESLIWKGLKLIGVTDGSLYFIEILSICMYTRYKHLLYVESHLLRINVVKHF